MISVQERSDTTQIIIYSGTFRHVNSILNALKYGLNPVNEQTI